MRSRTPGLIRILFAALCLANGAGLSPEAAPRLGERQRLAVERAAALRADLLRARAAAEILGAGAPDRSRSVAAPLALASGDLLSATAKGSELIVMRPRGNKVKVMAVPVGHDFVPRGIDVSAGGLVAIAAVSQVLLYDPATDDLRVYTRPEGQGSRFGFATDVQFDRKGKLLIADMGAEPIGKSPTDGRLWQLDPDTDAIVRLAARRPLSNPKLLALDSKGRVLVVDGEGGLPIAPLVDGHYDFVYVLKGKQRAGAKPVFREPGLQATAFDIDAEDRAWFGLVGEVVTLQGGSLSYPCMSPPPFTFLNGLIVDGEDTAQALDGTDGLPGPRVLWQVDGSCEATRRLQGPRVADSRGLARFEPGVD